MAARRMVYEWTRWPAVLEEQEQSAGWLAEQVGVDRSYLSKLKRRGDGWPAWLAEQIAAALRLPVGEVFAEPQWYERQGVKWVPIAPPEEEPEAATAPEPDAALGVAGYVPLGAAAEQVGLNSNTLLYAIKRGKLPARQLGGSWLVRMEDVRAYLAQRRSWRSYHSHDTSAA